jgi:hypothetical protein
MAEEANMTEKLNPTEARQGRADGTGRRIMVGSAFAAAIAVVAIVLIGPENISALVAG